MKIDVTQIPNLEQSNNAYISVDDNGDLATDNINPSKILHLDVNGYAGTPVKGDPRRPYQTHAAALADYVGGDMIKINGFNLTTSNLSIDGVNVVYLAPTFNDKLVFTPDYQPMIFTGGDSDGTGVELYGDGEFIASGLVGAPSIQMTGSISNSRFICKAKLTLSSVALLLGGTDGYIDFNPSIIRFTSSLSGQNLISGGSETSGYLRVSCPDVEISDQIDGSVLLGFSVGGTDSVLYIQDVNIRTSVTQVATDNYLLSSNSSAVYGVSLYGDIYCSIPSIDLYDNLPTAPTNPYRLVLSGNIETTGNRNTGTATDSDFEFTGTGIINTADKRYLVGTDLDPNVRTFQSNTVEFITTIGDYYGTYTSPRTGVLTYDETDAVDGAISVIYHQDASFNLPSDVIFQNGTYTPNEVNKIYIERDSEGKKTISFLSVAPDTTYYFTASFANKTYGVLSGAPNLVNNSYIEVKARISDFGKLNTLLGNTLTSSTYLVTVDDETVRQRLATSTNVDGTVPTLSTSNFYRFKLENDGTDTKLYIDDVYYADLIPASESAGSLYNQLFMIGPLASAVSNVFYLDGDFEYVDFNGDVLNFKSEAVSHLSESGSISLTINSGTGADVTTLFTEI